MRKRPGSTNRWLTRAALKRAALVCLPVLTLAASEHHGVVKFGGLPVPGATVTVAQDDRRFTAVTDPQGVYAFPDLPDGVWKLKVEMLCFTTIERDIAIAPNAPAAEWELKLRPLDEIKAAAGPPPAPAVAPRAVLQAGASPPPAAPEQPAKPGKSGFQRADLNASSDAARLESEPAGGVGDVNQSADGFLVNGSVNNGAASPFAQSAAFGNFRRNGRSLYTGSLGVTLGNSALDARSFSLTGQNTPKAAYNHLTGLASFGGPLKIPHLPQQSPANVVVNYQWMRNRNASVPSTLMPTAAERGGDFSQFRIFDPRDGMPFPGGLIPPDRISPQAKALLNFYPLPNFDAGARYNYQIPLVGIANQDSLQSRVFKMITPHNQLFGNFAFQRTASENPNLFGFVDASHTAGVDTAVNWSHRIHQRTLMNFRVQYNRQSARLTPYFANRVNVSGDAGITGNNQDPLNWGPPSLSFASGIAGLSDAQQSFTRNQTASVGYDTFWNHRGHNVRFGADYRRQQFNHLAQQNARGAFTFTGASTQAAANGVPAPGTGSDLAGFLLGIPDTSSLAFGNADKYFRASLYDAYFTDDWRLSPSFTLNAGLRWEYGSPITELYGRLVNLDIPAGFAAEAPVVAATPLGALTGARYPDSLVYPDKHAWQPRIGIAWRPLAGSSMIVRAGYGITYDTSIYSGIADRMAQQSPLSKSLSVPNTPANPLTLASGFNASPATTPNTFAVDPYFRVGYAQTWSASVQRDLPGSLMITGTYLGIKGTRARQEFLPNTFPAGFANPCPACPAGYSYLTSNGNSTRESGSVQLRRRLRSGFTWSLQYTLSKSIDDAALGGRGQGGSVIAQDWLNLRGERGLSNFDQRHLLAAQIQYTTGTGIGGGTLLDGWKGVLFKDWTFASQITAGSGLPQTPVYVAAVRGTGVTGSIRPDYTGAPLYAAPAGLFLNPAAYLAPAAGRWGNAGRDTITGPAQFTLNASMARTFRLSDRFNADLRFDAVNALNHVTFAGWQTNITSAQFGLPTAANAMRTMQANLRVRF